jgi:hypothetical protein
VLRAAADRGTGVMPSLRFAVVGVFLLGVITRLTGVVREIIVASEFGASHQARPSFARRLDSDRVRSRGGGADSRAPPCRSRRE